MTIQNRSHETDNSPPEGLTQRKERASTGWWSLRKLTSLIPRLESDQRGESRIEASEERGGRTLDTAVIEPIIG